MPFSTFGLHADILRGVKELAFTHPTPIQKEAIAPALAGRDLLACAQTGSGKTAAFMLPIIHKLMTKPAARRAARVLVLTPTRELAVQILENLNSLAMYTPISGAAIIGGVGMGPQAHAFRTGTEILIATPGRLLDHLRQPYAKLDGVEILVLDEADRMLDMGFLPDIKRILKVLPAKKQTLFFSATMPGEIRQLTHELLKDPVTIQIDRQQAPAVGITQAIYPVPQHLKTNLLKKLLEDAELESVICFTRTKHRANRLAATLAAAGISCVPIHGNRTQGQRQAALGGFKEGKFRVLVATDIAARGIDIADVSHVINFDCPHLAEDYIHRVGRTGRASAVGDAFTFVAEDEQGNLRVIERAIGKRLPRVTLPDFDYAQKSTERLEVPIAQRIAAIRAQKATERANRESKGGGARVAAGGGHGGGFGGHGGGQRTPTGLPGHAVRGEKHRKRGRGQGGKGGRGGSFGREGGGPGGPAGGVR
jgi:ATP-dependent RNA helicase RhlE